MAIAMMVNAQHLMYRAESSRSSKSPPPRTCAEVLAAAEKIKAAGKVHYPLGATMKTGWNLAEDFVNMYLGYGGSFFGGRQQAPVKNEAGVKTLETMKALTAYMDPEYLTADSTSRQKQFQQGRIAMANFWASRAGAMDNAAELQVAGKVMMAAAPAMAPGRQARDHDLVGRRRGRQERADAEAEAAFRLMAKA